jgi:hypothetical protein
LPAPALIGRLATRKNSHVLLGNVHVDDVLARRKQSARASPLDESSRPPAIKRLAGKARLRPRKALRGSPTLYMLQKKARRSAMEEPIQETQGAWQGLGGPNGAPPPQGFYTTYEMELSRRVSELAVGQKNFVLKSDLSAMATTIVAEIKAELNAVKTEIKTEFDAVKTKLNTVEIKLLAEISGVKEKLNSADKRNNQTAVLTTLIAAALFILFGFIICAESFPI